MGVEDEEQMKNKQEEASRTTMVLSVSNGQRRGGSRPINRTFSTGSGQKPVLKGHSYKPVLKALPRPVALAGAKGDPLAPVCNTNRC